MGFEITRSVESRNRLSNMAGGLIRAKERKHTPATIIDVGAAQGFWTIEAMKFWPNADYLLIEPLDERKQELEKLSQQHPNLHFVNAAAGKGTAQIDFHVTRDLDGSGIADNGGGSLLRTVPVTSIDIEVERLGLKPPYAIKLDTHGYEVPILEGAAQTLKGAELLIIECYGFHIAPGSLLFWELCRFLEERGFRVIDIVDISRRNYDLAFWQCDIFFAPIKHRCFEKNTYV